MFHTASGAFLRPVGETDMAKPWPGWMPPVKGGTLPGCIAFLPGRGVKGRGGVCCVGGGVYTATPVG